MNIKGLKISLSLLFAALLISCALLPSRAAAKDVISVKAEGVSRSSAEGAELKNKAIEEALKAGIKEAVSSILKSERIEAEASAVEGLIYSNPRSFVLNYKILSEEVENEASPDGAPPVFPEPQEGVPAEPFVYRIWLEADIDAGGLKGALTKIASTSGTESSVKIIMLDMPDWETYKSLVASIERIASLKELRYDSFYKGRFLLTAKITTDKKTFMERISQEAGGGCVVIEGGWQTIIVKAVPDALSGAFER